jgi:hypothetical protein
MAEHDARSPYEHNDYPCSMDRAKLQETRQKRLNQMLEELVADGDRYMNVRWRRRTGR